MLWKCLNYIILLLYLLLFLSQQLSLFNQLLLAFSHNLLFPTIWLFLTLATWNFFRFVHFVNNIRPNILHLFVQLVQSLLYRKEKILLPFVSFLSLMEKFLFENYWWLKFKDSFLFLWQLVHFEFDFFLFFINLLNFH